MFGFKRGTRVHVPLSGFTFKNHFNFLLKLLFELKLFFKIKTKYFELKYSLNMTWLYRTYVTSLMRLLPNGGIMEIKKKFG